MPRSIRPSRRWHAVRVATTSSALGAIVLALGAALLVAPQSAKADTPLPQTARPPSHCLSFPVEPGTLGLPPGTLAYDDDRQRAAEAQLYRQGLDWRTSCSPPVGYVRGSCYPSSPENCYPRIYRIGNSFYGGYASFERDPNSPPPPSTPPTPTPSPSPSTPPDGYQCGTERLSRADVDKVLAEWTLGDRRAAVEADPCVLLQDWEAWVDVAAMNWSYVGGAGAGSQSCGKFEWRANMNLTWRAAGVTVDSPEVLVTQDNICWDRLRNEFNSGSVGVRPASPRVEILHASRIFPLQVTKAGVGGSGVSGCTTGISVLGNRVEPAGGWSCTLEANITFTGGIALGAVTSGGPWTRQTPSLDFWRIPGGSTADACQAPGDACPVGNAGFETGSDWVLSDNARLNTEAARSGTYATELSGNYSRVEQHVEGLSPGTRYRLSGWMKVEDPDEPIRLGVKWFDFVDTVADIPATTTGYAPYSVDFTTGPDSTSAFLYVWRPAGASSGWVDDVMLTQL